MTNPESNVKKDPGSNALEGSIVVPSGVSITATGSGIIQATTVAGLGTMATQNANNVNITGGAISGTSFTGSIAGNASTASALQTGRTINGVTFDGTSNIVVPAAAGTLTGSALASGVTSASGLLSASVGTFGSMAVQNSTSVSISGGTITGAGVTGLPAPVASSDAVRLTDLNGVSAGITQRTGVQLATTANLTLSGEQTIDGVLTSASRILVKNQTTTSQNGIYVTAAGAWSRASDSNTAGQLKVGYLYFVSAGTSNASSSWAILTAPTTLGTDPVVFAQFSASASYTAGTGLSLVGSQFSLNAAQSGLTLTSSIFNGTVGATTPSTGSFTSLSSTGGALNGTVGSTTPAAGTFTALTSTSGAINGTVGATTPAAGTFTALNSTSGALNGTIGATTPAAGTFTAVNASGTVTGANLSTGGQVTSTVATGTAPLVVSSTTQVANLRATSAATSTAVVATDDNATNATVYPTWVVGPSSGVAVELSSTKLSFNPSTGVVTSIFGASSNANGITTKNNFHLRLNVKDYGAKVDGSTNDTVAVAAAFAAAGVNSTVYFPAGICITDQISLTGATAKTFVSIVGDGMGASIIKHRTANDTSGVIALGTDSTDITIEGLTFDGNCTARQAGAHAVLLYGSRVRFYNNEIKNCGQFSIYTGGGTPADMLINNNYIHNGYADGINMSGCNNSVCVGNIVDLVGDDCWVAYGANSFNITCTGNLFRGWSALASTTGRGILVSSGAHDLVISNNRVDSIQQAGLLIDNEGGGRPFNISLKNNQFTNCNLFSADVAVINSADKVTLEGNDIAATNSGDCIKFADVTDFVIKGGTLVQPNSGDRGIHADESTSWNGTTWTRINIKGVTFNCTNASFCQCIYLAPASGVTMSYLTIDCCVEMQQVTAGDYITIGGSSATAHKICNNISSHGLSIHDYAGSATIVNNN